MIFSKQNPKRIFLSCLFLFVFLLSIFPGEANAADTGVLAQNSLAKLSADYLKKYPITGMKKGLAVLPFVENSETAKSRGLGITMREVISGLVIESQVFFLVDRDNLGARMKELELSMTGLVDEKEAVKAGKQAGVKVFVAGSISDAGDDLLVAIKLIDVETGEVVAQDSFQVTRESLMAKRREIAFSYIAKHGIGINFQTSYMFASSSMDQTTEISDIFLSYRPALWLNFKLGMSYLFVSNDPGDQRVPIATMFPTVDDANNYITEISGETTGVASTEMSEVAPYLGVEYNFMITEKFSIALGVGATVMAFGPELEQRFSGAVTKIHDFSDGTDNAQMNNTMVLTQKFDPTAMVRFEIKPQYFITPRATFGLNLGYIWTPPMKVQSTDYGDGYTLYPHDSAGATDPFDKRFGFNPLQFGLDGNVEEDFSLSGFTVGVSLSFFF